MLADQGPRPMPRARRVLWVPLARGGFYAEMESRGPPGAGPVWSLPGNAGGAHGANEDAGSPCGGADCATPPANCWARARARSATPFLRTWRGREPSSWPAAWRNPLHRKATRRPRSLHERPQRCLATTKLDPRPEGRGSPSRHKILLAPMAPTKPCALEAWGGGPDLLACNEIRASIPV